jgi:hypothetical protein
VQGGVQTRIEKSEGVADTFSNNWFCEGEQKQRLPYMNSLLMASYNDIGAGGRRLATAESTLQEFFGLKVPAWMAPKDYSLLPNPCPGCGDL